MTADQYPRCQTHGRYWPCSECAALVGRLSESFHEHTERCLIDQCNTMPAPWAPLPPSWTTCERDGESWWHACGCGYWHASLCPLVHPCPTCGGPTPCVLDDPVAARREQRSQLHTGAFNPHPAMGPHEPGDCAYCAEDGRASGPLCAHCGTPTTSTGVGCDYPWCHDDDGRPWMHESTGTDPFGLDEPYWPCQCPHTLHEQGCRWGAGDFDR